MQTQTAAVTQPRFTKAIINNLVEKQLEEYLTPNSTLYGAMQKCIQQSVFGVLQELNAGAGGKFSQGTQRRSAGRKSVAPTQAHKTVRARKTKVAATK